MIKGKPEIGMRVTVDDPLHCNGDEPNHGGKGKIIRIDSDDSFRVQMDDYPKEDWFRCRDCVTVIAKDHKMKPTHTNSILSCIRACYGLIQRGGPVSQDLGFSDQAHTADGTMLVITDNTDGQQYELTIVPLELAEANREDRVKQSFDEAVEP